MPDGIKRIAAPLIRKQLVDNKLFLDQYELLESAKHMSTDELQERQLIALRNLLLFAYENTPFYKRSFDISGFNPSTVSDVRELSKSPLLTKKDIRDSFTDLQATSIEDYYEATTGGSSGEPIRVCLERASIYKERAFVYSFWARAGYDFRRSKVAVFRGVEFGGKIKKENPLYNEMLLNPFLLNKETLPQYVKAMKEFGCDFIQGYPSSIRNFCRLVQGANVGAPEKIKAVFFISETVEQDVADYVTSVLGCPCRAFYGHSERSVFAEQLTDNVLYQFNPEYGVSEIVEHPEGNIVCTGFLNRRMPLIRYAVDDYAVLDNSGLYKIEGHRNGVGLIGNSGEQITQTALNFHGGIFDEIDGGYQLIQTVPGRAECRIRPSRSFDPQQVSAVLASLRSKTGNTLDWDVVQGVDFELTTRGKAKLVIQKIDQSDEI